MPRPVSIAMAGPNLKRCLRDQADYKAVDALKSCFFGVSSHPFGEVFHKAMKWLQESFHRFFFCKSMK